MRFSVTTFTISLTVILALGIADTSRAGMLNLDMVPVGNPYNKADSTGFGAVSYNYLIDQVDVTAGQYTAFLNAVAKNDTYNLYTASMATDTTYGCGILRSGVAGSYSYSTTKNPNYPVNYVSWGDAARFCNWLTNGQPNGGETLSTTESGYYYLNGATTDSQLAKVATPSRNGTVAGQYFIPSEDEWYKAAFYKSGGTASGYWKYATKSNTVPSNLLSSSGTNNANYYANGVYTDPTNYLTPVGYFAGSPSPYGTLDQAGDVRQWQETNYSSGTTYVRGVRGGAYGSTGVSLQSSTNGSAAPTTVNASIGFRVAVVPEPGSIALLLSAAVSCLIGWKRRR